MRYNVAQLIQEETGSFRQYDVEGELSELDEYNVGPIPVVGHLTLIRTVRGVLAHGTFSLSMTEPCRRCLEFAVVDAVLDVEEEFTPSTDIETGASLPRTDDDEPDLMIDAHHILDLRDAIRQYAVAEGTAGTLCAADCRGLCPMCGVNRNTATCDCDTQRVDPRLQVLAQLLPSAQQPEDPDREIE